MKFVKLEVVIGEDGRTVEKSVNADQICMLTPIVIPTGIMGGPSGDIPITKPGTGLDFGVKITPVVGEIEDVQKRLEEEEG